MSTVNVRTGEVTLTTVKLTKSILNQMPIVEQFVRDYLPGGKEAQDPEFKLIGWVHGTVFEKDEHYWCWLIVQLRAGEFIRMRIAKENISRPVWKVKQLYVV